MLRFHFVVVLLTTVAVGLPASAQRVDASATGGPTPLDAPWRLHFGDGRAFAQPGFDDSQWMLHPIEKNWASEGRKGYAGYAWYRLRVLLPASKEPLAMAIYPPGNHRRREVLQTIRDSAGDRRKET
jgi:hypothetical protein